jgi:hypothetical protein
MTSFIPRIAIFSKNAQFEFFLQNVPLTAIQALELMENLNAHDGSHLWAFRANGSAVTVFREFESPIGLTVDTSKISSSFQRPIELIAWMPATVIRQFLTNRANIQIELTEQNRITTLKEFLDEYFRV